MQKKINMKERIVEYWGVSTKDVEDDVIGFINRQMRVVFHDAYFNNRRYVFIRKATDQSAKSIMVSDYRRKQPGENISVSFK